MQNQTIPLTAFQSPPQSANHIFTNSIRNHFLHSNPSPKPRHHISTSSFLYHKPPFHFLCTKFPQTTTLPLHNHISSLSCYHRQRGTEGRSRELQNFLVLPWAGVKPGRKSWVSFTILHLHLHQLQPVLSRNHCNRNQPSKPCVRAERKKEIPDFLCVGLACIWGNCWAKLG